MGKRKMKKTSKMRSTTPIDIQCPLLREDQPSRSVEDEEGDGFGLNVSTPSRGHGVQPLGNLYLSTSLRPNSRNTGLGNLQILTDELILEILGFLDPHHLGILSTVSKSLYIFCSHDPLWRDLVLQNSFCGFKFHGSWKITYIAAFNKSSFNKTFTMPTSRLLITDFYSDYLFQSWLCASLEMKTEWLQIDNIPRRMGISVDEFMMDFEEPNKPVLLEGCLNKWAAFHQWDRDHLLKLCRDVRFSVGPVEMTLDDYFQYSDQAMEERPLYLFDQKFAEKVPQLDCDYEVPSYFKEDLFSVLGSGRPDYRWIIMGPARSGSSFHIDPNSTSAWNAVIRGSKKWILFPPDVVPPGVHPSHDGAEVASPVSLIEWFMNYYGSWKKRPVECVCKAGEVIFVPNGWWHLVINLEDSIAITQNFVSRRNLVSVLDFLKRPNAEILVSGTPDRVNLYNKFTNALEASFPGIIHESLVKEKARQRKKISVWESAMDSKVGAFKFSF